MGALEMSWTCKKCGENCRVPANQMDSIIRCPRCGTPRTVTPNELGKIREADDVAEQLWKKHFGS